MNDYTPGPWTYHFEPTLNRHIVRAGFAGERTVCSTYGNGLECEAAANSRLIAAAPDLLTALKLTDLRLSEVRPTHGTHATDLAAYLRPVILRAIAKAEGR